MVYLRHTFAGCCASKGTVTTWTMVRLYFTGFLALLLVAAASVTPAAPTPQSSAAAPRAHDAHQGVDVTADPYIDAARSKEKFGKKHPQEAGLLALEMSFRNDNDQPISLNLERIRLAIEAPGERRQNLDPLSVDDAADRIVQPKGPSPSISRRPLPGPRPRGGRGKDWQKLRDALHAVALASDVLPPHATTRGFLFFDLNHHFDLLSHASLYIAELRFIPSREELLYFEVELAPAVNQ